MKQKLLLLALSLGLLLGTAACGNKANNSDTNAVSTVSTFEISDQANAESTSESANQTNATSASAPSDQANAVPTRPSAPLVSCRI